MALITPRPKPVASDETIRRVEIERLAEKAWVALLAAPRHATDGFHNIASQAWSAAEIMHAESERRRQVAGSDRNAV